MKEKNKRSENKTVLFHPHEVESFVLEMAKTTTLRMQNYLVPPIFCSTVVLETTKKLQYARAQQSRSRFILWRWHVSQNGCRRCLRRIARVMSVLRGKRC
ncbi:unnamed protein product [Ectocarpus fasciculatus]